MLAFCGTNDKATRKDKNTLNLIVEIKRKECGQSPPPFSFLVPESASAYGVQVCTLAIIEAPCPFTTYPLLCLEAFNKDVPNIGPKKEK